MKGLTIIIDASKNPSRWCGFKFDRQKHSTIINLGVIGILIFKLDFRTTIDLMHTVSHEED